MAGHGLIVRIGRIGRTSKPSTLLSTARVTLTARCGVDPICIAWNIRWTIVWTSTTVICGVPTRKGS
jgi:hypothetical protein